MGKKCLKCPPEGTAAAQARGGGAGAPASRQRAWCEVPVPAAETQWYLVAVMKPAVIRTRPSSRYMLLGSSPGSRLT